MFEDLKRREVWRAWTDINNWPKWHEDLESCKLAGKFEVGGRFVLKPKGWAPAVRVELTAIDEDRSFTDCTNFFGAKMYNTHALVEVAHAAIGSAASASCSANRECKVAGRRKTAGDLKLTNTVVVTGPLWWLWVALVARKVARDLPCELDELVKLVRGRGSSHAR